MSEIGGRGVVFKYLLNLVAIIAVIGVLGACETSSQGVGVGVSSSDDDGFSDDSGSTSSQKGIQVLDLDFQDAMELALNAAKRAYVTANRSGDTIRFYNSMLPGGDVKGQIKIQFVEEKGSGRRGVYYDVTAKGVGNVSFIPGTHIARFFTALGETVSDRDIPSYTFVNYVKIKNQGSTETIAASIPIEYEAFINYLEGKEKLGLFEGIWTSHEGNYTLGLVYDESDIRFPYKAFVIESDRSNWKPGEIKIKFSRLDATGVALGRYWLANKSERGIVFDVKLTTMLSVNNDLPIALIRTYPRADDIAIAGGGGQGTGWYAGNSIFVTNAHVIARAKTITLHFNGREVSGRVIAVDSDLDLALVKVNEVVSLKPIPFVTGGRASQPVFAVGYPLSSTAGRNVKISNGIISALSGYKDQQSNFTITASVEPGNSGGPLVDENGNAVGVISAKHAGAENINYAIKSEYLVPMLKSAGVTSVPRQGRASNVCDLVCPSVVLIETER